MIAINAASPRWEARYCYSNLQQMSGNGPSEDGGLRSGWKLPLKVGAPVQNKERGVCPCLSAVSTQMSIHHVSQDRKPHDIPP